MATPTPDLEQLRQVGDELEQRINERTSQLSVINAELLIEIAERERAEMELTLVNDELAADLKSMIRLHGLSTRLLATTETHPLLEEILDAFIELLGADFGNIQLYDPQSNRRLAPDIIASGHSVAVKQTTKNNRKLPACPVGVFKWAQTLLDSLVLMKS